MAKSNPLALALALFATALAPSVTAYAANSAQASCPQPFKVTFDVQWRGMSAGTSTLQLVRKGANEFTYTSNNVARGIFRLAIPDTVTQTSDFSIVEGTVRPSAYVADDGSADTSRDVSLKFDWEKGRVAGIAEDRPVDQPIAPGVQDSLSVQIALMCALAAGESPKTFELIDKDEVKEYVYTREGNATIDSPLGKLDTVVYTSQRPGASRLTRLWIAPSLGYLPVRGEQMRKGKRELQLSLRGIERS